MLVDGENIAGLTFTDQSSSGCVMLRAVYSTCGLAIVWCCNVFQLTGGRVVEWYFQSGEPVYYCNDTVSGYTTIKDISTAGVFTVHMAPTVKNEIALAEKYVNR